jgi:hypothetical protein
MTPGVLLGSTTQFTRRLFALVFVLSLRAPVAHADTIVDTGPGSLVVGALALYSGQWLAGEFTVAQAYTVTSLEGWIFTETPGDLTVTLYGGGSDIPGVTLFSRAIRASPFGEPAWTGATNLQWLIAPGAYWAAFEVRDASTFAGAMPHPSQTPVVNEAYTDRGSPYIPDDDIDLGLRILGDPVAPTPEPSTLALLGTSAIALGGRAWRRITRRPSYLSRRL